LSLSASDPCGFVDAASLAERDIVDGADIDLIFWPENRTAGFSISFCEPHPGEWLSSHWIVEKPVFCCAAIRPQVSSGVNHCDEIPQ